MLPLTRCFAWDRDPERASVFAAKASTEGLQAEVVRRSGDGGSGERHHRHLHHFSSGRFSIRDMVRAGTFVAAVGADSPEKSEIAPALMASAKVVADVLDQCVVMGDLQHAIAAGAMTREAVHAELAELVSGGKPGRTSADEIILFDSTGTGLQDVAAAAIDLRARRRRRPLAAASRWRPEHGGTAAPSAAHHAQIFWRFLRFGLLAWGGPVAQIAMVRRALVDEEQWVTSGRFNRLLAIYQVLPGPEAHELCVHLGMVAGGRRGGLAAGLGFMLPGFVLMLALVVALFPARPDPVRARRAFSWACRSASSR